MQESGAKKTVNLLLRGFFLVYFKFLFAIISLFIFGINYNKSVYFINYCSGNKIKSLNFMKLNPV